MTKLLWLDLEMTGLDVEKEVIIEVAAIVTDLKFNEIDQYHSIVCQPQKYIDDMDSWNTEHHGDSGLTAKIPDGKDPDLVEDDLCRFIEKHFHGERAVLAGNTIGQDKLFIAKYFKKMNELLHYRTLDVTSFKIIFKHIYEVEHEKKNTHRAMDDIKESIEELKTYLEYVHA